ncbi:TRAP transporter substrate-binding protein DctP [Sinobaca sp. H24]|uniref:TRAP transporter substrate-binding protein DctP n=1 Tax=Sinobaca sp. H24 TaxID=2923376 RepID=UPI002079B2BA|nr:TRAP transporter substrate-binding protein DctP [Sinobaca sp. H24]
MTQTPVNTPDDLAGMRIRVPDNNLFIRSFSTLGASPTPLPLGDLYASLQQGVIDGAENPLPVLAGSRTHEVTNYLNLTGHMTVYKSLGDWRRFNRRNARRFKGHFYGNCRRGG